MKSKIFISYSRRDYDVVIKLKDEIHRRTGELPWMDLSGIETGAQFADVIAGAIDSCCLLVFVISRHSAVSEWTRREVLYALEMHKIIYPVVIDDAQLPKELRLLLSNLNCIDIRDSTQRANFFSDLAAEVNQETLPVSSSLCQRGPVDALINGVKALRFKMTMMLLSRRSWMLYSVFGILLFVAVAYVYVSHSDKEKVEVQIAPLKEFKAEIEKNIEETKRDAQWAVVIGIGSSPADSYESAIGWRIDQVASTNETLAAELQVLLDKMMALDKKYEALQDEIGLQRDAASKNRKKGLSDEKEFARANRLAEERKKVDNEIQSIYSAIRGRLGVKK